MALQVRLSPLVVQANLTILTTGPASSHARMNPCNCDSLTKLMAHIQIHREDIYQATSRSNRRMNLVIKQLDLPLGAIRPSPRRKCVLMSTDPDQNHLPLRVRADPSPYVHIPDLLPSQPTGLVFAVEDMAYRMIAAGVDVVVSRDVLSLRGNGKDGEGTVEANNWRILGREGEAICSFTAFASFRFRIAIQAAASSGEAEVEWHPPTKEQLAAASAQVWFAAPSRPNLSRTLRLATWAMARRGASQGTACTQQPQSG